MTDEDFFFEGAERGDLLDALNGHAHDSATTVLEGATGSGVSTLLGMLSMSLVEGFELIRLDGAEELGANAAVDAMLVHFDIDREDLADTLKKTLAETSLVIVMDNVDQAPSGALATMATLKQKLGQRLTYVFGGESGSNQRLREAGVSIDDVLLLPPLEADEVSAFADQKFALTLDDDEAEDLCQQSDGNIGVLLPLLEAKAGGKKNSVIKPVPWRHGLAVGALILVVLILWLASGGDDEPARDQVVDLDLPPKPKVEESEPSSPDSEQAVDEQADDRVDSDSTRRALAEYHDSAEAFEQAERGFEQPPVDTAQDDAPTPPTSEPSVAEEALPESTNANTESTGSSDSDTSNIASDEPELSGLDARLEYRQEDWLATRDDDEWFLQLVATGREDGARSVLDQIDRGGAYYRAKRGDGQIYLVLAGPYSSRDEALAQRDELPEALQKGGPFPRNIASIRKELR